MMTAFLSLEQVTGVEPARPDWEAEVLPINYTCEYGYYIISQVQKEERNRYN